MRLARQNTLVQELEAVETLARVDCLNLDKTGTITDGGIVFDAIRMLPDDSAGTATLSDAILALRDVCDEATPNITGAAVLDAIEAIYHRDPLSGHIVTSTRFAPGWRPCTRCATWTVACRRCGAVCLTCATC